MAWLSQVILTAKGTDNWNVLKVFCCYISIKIVYKWHHSRISQTGTTQTAGVQNKGGNFIGQLCISVVPHWSSVPCCNLPTFLFVYSQKECRRYNFGYNPDRSDIRLEVTGGHSPIVNSNVTARMAFSPAAGNNQEQPLVNQPDVWGPIFRNRASFLEMHVA